ncbi:MAG: aldehyde dehydrogenase family protein, partial [Rhodomicrobium sp.]
MIDRQEFYIDGEWVAPLGAKTMPVVNPATEEAMYDVALGSEADVDKAVAAARAAFGAFATTSRKERVALLERVIEVYTSRIKDIGAAISDEMGAPLPFAERSQAGAGLAQLRTVLQALKTYPFEERLGAAMILREPIGVVGMITPWNWP